MKSWLDTNNIWYIHINNIKIKITPHGNHDILTKDCISFEVCTCSLNTANRIPSLDINNAVVSNNSNCTETWPKISGVVRIIIIWLQLIVIIFCKLSW